MGILLSQYDSASDVSVRFGMACNGRWRVWNGGMGEAGVMGRVVQSGTEWYVGGCAAVFGRVEG